MAWGCDLPGMCCYRHFKTVGYAAGTIDENDCSIRRKNLTRCLFKQLQPTVKMFVFQAQAQVWRHWAPIVASGFQNDGWPELADAFNMMIPIVHGFWKDWADQVVFAGSSIKSAHQSVDWCSVYGWMRLIDKNGHSLLPSWVMQRKCLLPWYSLTEPFYPVRYCRMMVLSPVKVVIFEMARVFPVFSVSRNCYICSRL